MVSAVRHACTSSMNTAAPKFRPCVWTGAMSGSCCEWPLQAGLPPSLTDRLSYVIAEKPSPTWRLALLIGWVEISALGKHLDELVYSIFKQSYYCKWNDSGMSKGHKHGLLPSNYHRLSSSLNRKFAEGAHAKGCVTTPAQSVHRV